MWIFRILLFLLLAGTLPLAAQRRGTIYYRAGDTISLSDSGGARVVSADGIISPFGDSALAIDRSVGPLVVGRERIVRVKIAASSSWTTIPLGLLVGAWAVPLLLGDEAYSEGGGLFGVTPQFALEWEWKGDYEGQMLAGAAGGTLAGLLVDLARRREAEVYRFDRPESRNETWDRLLDHLGDDQRVFRVAVVGGLISTGIEERFEEHQYRIGSPGNGAPWFIGEYPGPGRLQLLRSIEVSWFLRDRVELGLVAVDLSLGGESRGILREEEGREWSGYVDTEVSGAGYGASVAVRPIRQSPFDLRLAVDAGLARITVVESIGLAWLDEERVSDVRGVFIRPMVRLNVEGILHLNGHLNVGIRYDYAIVGEAGIEHPSDPSLKDQLPLNLSSSILGFVLGYEF